MASYNWTKGIFQRNWKIKYEGKRHDNPFAFRWYDENKMVAGKTMKDYLGLPVPTGIHSVAMAPILLVSLHIYFHGMKKTMQ